MAGSSKFTQKALFEGGYKKSKTSPIDTSYSANIGSGYQNNLVNLPILSSGNNGGVTDDGFIGNNTNVDKTSTINRMTKVGKPQTTPITYGQQLSAVAQQQMKTESAPNISGETGATGFMGSTGTTSAGNGTVDTYEEFLL